MQASITQIVNDQIKHYPDRLAYEIDSWDLKVTIESGEPVILVGTRSPQAYVHKRGHFL